MCTRVCGPRQEVAQWGHWRCFPSRWGSDPTGGSPAPLPFCGESMGYITWPMTLLPRWAEDRAGTFCGHCRRGPAMTGGGPVPTWPSQTPDVQWGLSDTEEGLGPGACLLGLPSHRAGWCQRSCDCPSVPGLHLPLPTHWLW